MPNYDTGAVRNLLTQVFPDADEIEFFCDDYFKEVKFEADMPLKKRAHLLSQYCAQHNQLDKLLALMQKNFPAKYAELSSTLLLEDTSGATATVTPATHPAPAVPEPQPPAQTVASEPEPPAQLATNEPSSSGVTAEPADMPQGQDIFISYSTKNLDFVKELYQRLSSRGLSVWFDKQSIEGATQWRESIVTGIMNCKVFVFVLSPESAASVNVRKEIDLAEHHKKKIFPLMWKDVNPLPPSIQYQLAGTQYISFNETPSEENFNKVYHVIERLLGGSAVTEAAPGEQAIQAAGVTNKPAATPPTQPSSGRPERGRRRGTAIEISAIATGITVMTKVVTQLTTFTADEQDVINEELTWLFAAVDHFLRIRRGEIQRTEPVPVNIPPQAKVEAGANNSILSTIKDFDLELLDMRVQAEIKYINTYIRNLAIELSREAQMGGAMGADLALTNSIKLQQKEIVKNTQNLAQFMYKIYGILVYGPDDIAKQLV